MKNILLNSEIYYTRSSILSIPENINKLKQEISFGKWGEEVGSVLPVTKATTTVLVAVIVAAAAKIINYLTFIPHLLCARNFSMYFSGPYNDSLR